MVATIVFIAFFLVLGLPAPAQEHEVAIRDLRRPTVLLSSPTERQTAAPEKPNGCPKRGVGFADGFTMGKDRKPRQIQLDMVKIDDTNLILGREIAATVRLQNVGTDPIQIPWSTDFRTTWKGQDPDHRKWEFGQFQMALGQGDKHYYDELITTSFPLYGSEFVPGSMLTVKPGEWITAQISFLVSVQRPQFESIETGPADLTLEWFQTVRRRDVEDCGITLGYFPYDSFYGHLNRVKVRKVQVQGPEKASKAAP